jgi:hypothetical protein
VAIAVTSKLPAVLKILEILDACLRKKENPRTKKSPYRGRGT